MPGAITKENFDTIVKNFEAMSEMAHGSQGGEGINGGAGYIGILNGKVVKFQTHWLERFGFSSKEERASCNALKESIKQMLLTLSQDENVMSQETLKNVCNKLGFKLENGNITYSHKSLLSRKCVAKAISAFRNGCVTGSTSQENGIDPNRLYVWGSSPRGYETIKDSSFEKIKGTNTAETKGLRVKIEDWMLPEADKKIAESTRKLSNKLSMKEESIPETKEIAEGIVGYFNAINKGGFFEGKVEDIAAQHFGDINRSTTMTLNKVGENEVNLDVVDIQKAPNKKVAYMNTIGEAFKNEGIKRLFLGLVNQALVADLSAKYGPQKHVERLAENGFDMNQAEASGLLGNRRDAYDAEGNWFNGNIYDVKIGEDGGCTVSVSVQGNADSISFFRDDTPSKMTVYKEKSYLKSSLEIKMTPLTNDEYDKYNKAEDKTVGIIDYKDNNGNSLSQCFKIEVTKASYEAKVELCPSEEAEKVLEILKHPL